MRARAPADVRLLFATRILRLLAYGFLSVVLALYLEAAGLSASQIGLLLTLTLVGDTLVSLAITTNADRLGRRRMLVIGAALMVLAGAVFASTRSFWLLLAAATVGVISPSGYEVGPFLSIEQASLAHILPDKRRTGTFAWYNLVGSFATAGGSLASGFLVSRLQAGGLAKLASYRVIVLVYAAIGAALAVLFLRLTRAIEPVRSAPPVAGAARPGAGAAQQDSGAARPGAGRASPSAGSPQPPAVAARPFLGLHRSKRIVLKLAGLFSLDAFAGGFVVQSLMAYWFHKRFGVQPALLGSIFFAANILAGVSALSAARVARRVGLINTMVFTHLPSNVLLMLVPLMPTLPLAIAVLLLRFAISQMDVPTRQSYTMAVVDPDERSAASGITSVARTTGASIAPVFTGLLLASRALMGVPFLVAGGLKIVYDLALLASFRGIKPPEEKKP
jgi:MFS family permease